MSLDDEILINSDDEIQSGAINLKKEFREISKLLKNYKLQKSKILMNKIDYDDIVKWGNDGYA